MRQILIKELAKLRRRLIHFYANLAPQTIDNRYDSPHTCLRPDASPTCMVVC
jgi:hypothetical protein